MSLLRLDEFPLALDVVSVRVWKVVFSQLIRDVNSLLLNHLDEFLLLPHLFETLFERLLLALGLLGFGMTLLFNLCERLLIRRQFSFNLGLLFQELFSLLLSHL
jgi:hypothetical protein